MTLLLRSILLETSLCPSNCLKLQVSVVAWFGLFKFKVSLSIITLVSLNSVLCERDSSPSGHTHKYDFLRQFSQTGLVPMHFILLLRQQKHPVRFLLGDKVWFSESVNPFIFLLKFAATNFFLLLVVSRNLLNMVAVKFSLSTFGLFQY